MAPSTPPTLEDTKEPPADQPPSQSLDPTLDSLTAEEISQDCKDILTDILQEVVVCSEAGVHGPNGPQTSCVSATCSLGGVSPPQNITLALANLVSTNARYRRKSYYNCGQCQTVLRNTTSCHCGNSIDFPANLFKKCWTNLMSHSIDGLVISSQPMGSCLPGCSRQHQDCPTTQLVIVS